MSKKNLFLVCLTAIIGIILIFPRSFHAPVENAIPSASLSVVGSPASSSASSASPPARETSVEVVLLAGQSSYSIRVPQGSSVYDAMKTLAASSSFAFDARYYSGLGYFIQEINGMKNADGAYWTLYMNGAYSLVGASDYRLSSGDRIEWKYEKK